MSSRLRRISSLEYFYIRSLWKCSPQDSLWSEMDSEEFAITSLITLQSTLVFTGFTAKSCQLIVPHSMTCLAVCLLFSSRHVVYAVSESKVHIHTRKTLKCSKVIVDWQIHLISCGIILNAASNKLLNFSERLLTSFNFYSDMSAHWYNASWVNNPTHIFSPVWHGGFK